MHDHKVLRDLGKRIKGIRKKKNLTQTEVAIRCNFEKASLSRIESGQSNPTVLTLQRLSKVLNTNIADMFAD